MNADPDTREPLANFGFEPWVASPAELARAAELDKTRYADIVSGAKVALD